MLKIPKLYQCIRIVLCYEFTFIIQNVRPLFHWFLAISLDSDIQRDAGGKMLRAKSDCCTFLQKFCSDSDGEKFWTVEQATGPHEVGIRGLPQLELQQHGNQPRLHNQMFSLRLHPINILIFCRGFCFYIHRLSSYPHRWVLLGWYWPLNHLFSKQWAILQGFHSSFQPWEGEPANNN